MRLWCAARHGKGHRALQQTLYPTGDARLATLLQGLYSPALFPPPFVRQQITLSPSMLHSRSGHSSDLKLASNCYGRIT